MRNTSVIEYSLIALFMIAALSMAFTYIWPGVQVVLSDLKLIGEALAGAK